MKQYKDHTKNRNSGINTSYDDIINLPHPDSAAHPRMPSADRAAQFSPFAALTGHQEAIKEAGRLTFEKAELDENAKSILDEKLQFLLEQKEHPPEAEIIYFQPDSKKSGGTYASAAGTVKKADLYRRTIVMDDGLVISVDSIVDIHVFC